VIEYPIFSLANAATEGATETKFGTRVAYSGEDDARTSNMRTARACAEKARDITLDDEKISRTLVHKQIKIRPEFLPTPGKFCILVQF